jgi:molybdate transport system ATP-binding protein
LLPDRTVQENFAFAGAEKSAMAEIAESLELSSLLSRRPRLLSGGGRQRVALGRALLSNPRLLLLDEPFSALNKSLRGKVVQFVGKHCARRGIPIVLVGHDLDDLRQLGAEIWEVRDSEKGEMVVKPFPALKRTSSLNGEGPARSGKRAMLPFGFE